MLAGRNAAVATGVKLSAGFAILETKVITVWYQPGLLQGGRTSVTCEDYC